MQRLFNCHNCNNGPIAIDCSLLSKIKLCLVCKVNMGSITIRCCNSAMCQECASLYQPLNSFEEEKVWAVKQAKLTFGLKTGKLYTSIPCVLGQNFFILKRDYIHGPINIYFYDEDISNENFMDKLCIITEGYKCIHN